MRPRAGLGPILNDDGVPAESAAESCELLLRYWQRVFERKEVDRSRWPEWVPVVRCMGVCVNMVPPANLRYLASWYHSFARPPSRL